MSIALVNQLERISVPLTFAEMSILHWLADKAQANDEVYIRVTRIASLARCDERTVRRNLRRLEAKRMIVPLDDAPHGRGVIGSWRVTLGALPEPPEPHETEERPRMDAWALAHEGRR